MAKKPKKAPIKKAAPKIPVPLKEWDKTSEFPLTEIAPGDEVESKYHGKGVVKKVIGGPHPVQIDFGGRLMTYSISGRYFSDDSAFADQKPALIITRKNSPKAKEE